jgi:hypothetical protein
MKKYILTIMLFSLGFAGYAQVGIGTATPTTTLHVVESGSFSSTTGITIPVVTEDMTTTTTDGTEVSQLVYSTNASSTGYYYWNGTAWKALMPNSLSYLAAQTSTSLTITDSNDIIEFTGTSLATWTLPGNVPVGRLFYIVNNSPTFNGVEFSNTIITGKADVDATAGATLIHVGSGNYAIVSSL